MFKSSLFLCLIFSVAVTAMNPTKVITVEDKAQFFAERGLTVTDSLRYQGDYMGSLELLGLCRGGQSSGNLPRAFDNLTNIALGFLDAASRRQIEKTGIALIKPDFSLLVQHRGKKQTAKLAPFYARLIESPKVSQIVFVVQDNNKAKFNDAIYLAPTDNRGWGAFASRTIRTGEAIEYIGRVWLFNYHPTAKEKPLVLVSRKPEAQLEESLRVVSETKDSIYIAALLPRDPQLILMGDTDSQPERNLHVIVDAQKERNESAFFNHSRFGNFSFARALKITLSIDKNNVSIAKIEYALYLVANRTIEKDEELVWDYEFSAETLEKLRTSGIEMTDFNPKNRCYGCGKEKSINGDKLKACDQCRTARYCSRECQVKDWKLHKVYCHKKDKHI